MGALNSLNKRVKGMKPSTPVTLYKSDVTALIQNMDNLNLGKKSVVPVAYNATDTLTAADLAKGVITSTSLAAVTLTLPTATLAAGALGATQGTSFTFIIDNSAGANTVTVAVGTGITVPTGAITGGQTLTVTTTHKVGVFTLYFTSTTSAVLYRIA